MNNAMPKNWKTQKKKMDKFLDTYSSPKVSQDKIGNLNRPITRTEKNLLKKKKEEKKKNSLSTKVQD